MGSFGTMMRTADSGETWTTIFSGTTNSLRSVHFSNSLVGLAVGSRGTVIRTTDGGNNWTPQSSGVLKALYSVYMADVNTATAVGDTGTIIHSTDGGITWSIQTSGTLRDLRDVSFVHPDTGYIVGENGRILYTENSGTMWTRQQSGTANTLLGVNFIGPNLGIAVGSEGTILRKFNSITRVDSENEIRDEFSVRDCYPNPFNSSTVVSFSVPSQAFVTLRIFDILGREVSTLRQAMYLDRGDHGWEIQAKDLSTGVYFYRIDAVRTSDPARIFTQVRKMVLIK